MVTKRSEIHKKFFMNKNKLQIRQSIKKQNAFYDIEKIVSEIDEMTAEEIERIYKDNYSAAVKNATATMNSVSSSTGWKAFKRLTKYGKKLGQVLSIAEDPITGSILTGDDLNKALLDKYTIEKPSNQTCTPVFPDDYLIDEEQAFNIGKRLARLKALSHDCLPDNTFQPCRPCRQADKAVCSECLNKVRRLQDLFRRTFWEQPASLWHLRCRLIALKKTSDRVPTVNLCRYIVVTSPVIKALELSLYDDLLKNSSSYLDFSQHGFLPGHNTRHNLIDVISQASMNFKNGYALFIDFRTAFDAAPRHLIYQLIRKYKILNEKQLNLLEFIHGNLSIKLGYHETKTYTGVPQGLITSPILFNLILDNLVKYLKDCNTFTSSFADDMLSLANSINGIIATIKRVASWSQQTGIQINSD